MSPENDFDYWMEEGTAPENPAKSPLLVATINGVEPLDGQFSVDVPKTAPDALYDALFGQPEPIETEMGGASAKVPALHTYVILDAAKVTNLPEMLETSQLEHRCFFKGAVYENLKGVAPWIVRLEEGNTFSQNLFTQSNAPWHLWGREHGIYIRSRQPFDKLWQHFRKFTKTTGDTSGTSFLRYWEVHTLEAFVAWPEKFPAITEMLGVIFSESHILFNSSKHDSFFQISLPAKMGQNRLPQDLRADLKRARFYCNMFDQAEDFHESYPIEAARYGGSAKALRRPLFEAVNEIYEAGLTDPQLRARFLLLAIIKYPQMWPAMCHEPGWQAIRADTTNANERFRDLCAIMKHYSDRRQGTLKTWW